MIKYTNYIMILLIEDFQLNFQVVSFKKKEKCTLIIGVNYELRMVWSNVRLYFYSLLICLEWSRHRYKFLSYLLGSPHQVWLDLHRWNQEHVATTDLIPPGAKAGWSFTFIISNQPLDQTATASFSKSLRIL